MPSRRSFLHRSQLTLAATGALLVLAQAGEASGAPKLPEPPPGSTCVFIQRGTLGEVWDADVSSDNGNWAAGAYPYTWTGPSPDSHYSLYRFDTSAVPPGVEVVLAAFSTYVSWNDQSSQVRVHRITKAWDEATVTWQSFGAGSWDPAVIGDFDAGGVGHRTVDVTSLVQGWRGGQFADNGLLLEEDPVHLHAYFSSETGTVGLRPSLYVCYVAGGGGGSCPGGASCDDGLACTYDSCEGGSCQHTVKCPPGQPCSQDFCSSPQGQSAAWAWLCANGGQP